MADPELLRRAKERVGATLNGKYRLERLLGVGGMSAVYGAVHRNGNRVAVKILHPRLSADADVRRRFLQEGYAANNVDHPGVVRVLDDDTSEGGETFLVMELLEGGTLAQHAERSGGALPHRLVMIAAHQLLDVLAAAEDKGIVHRDIKPDNLFFTADGSLKLLDFGLARLLDKDAVDKSTVDGTVFGTPGFMPPEQVLGDKSQIDHRTDLWAAGATMFTLLSGRLVHEALTPAQQLVFAASRPARSLAAAAPATPPAIVALVDRALQFDRRQRWPSARAMQEAIEQAFPSLYSEPPPPRRSRSSRPSMTELAQPSAASLAPTIKQDGRGRRLVIAAAIGASVIAIGIGVALLAGRGDEPEESGAAPIFTVTAPSAEVTVTPAASDSSATTAPPSAATATAPGARTAPQPSGKKKPGGRPSPFDRQ